jgi:hypothetical protein
VLPGFNDASPFLSNSVLKPSGSPQWMHRPFGERRTAGSRFLISNVQDGPEGLARLRRRAPWPRGKGGCV